MKIFVSYAGEDRSVADELAVRLRTEKHTVFLDRDDLPDGEAYDNRIREAIADCDLYLFLVSPASIKSGHYTLTELKFAREQFPNPRGHVLSVLIKPTPFADIPSYLTAVTVLRPEGNVVAETVAEVLKMQKRQGRRWLRLSIPVLLLVLLAGAAAWWRLGANKPTCRLTLTAVGGGPGLALDLTTPEGPRAVPLGAGTAALEMGPFNRRDFPWSVILRARDGSLVGQHGFSGCPTSHMEVAIGDRHALVLEPR